MPSRARAVKESERVDFILLAVILSLLLFGLVMLFSASSPRALADGNIYSIIGKQGSIAALSVIIMFVVSGIDYHRYKKMSTIILVAAIIAMYVVPIIGFASHGAKRQISFGSISFQPSEIAKFALVIYYSARFSSKKTSELKNNVQNTLVSFGVLLAFILACGLQSHMSAAVVLAAISIMIMFAAGLSKKWLYAFGISGIAGFAFMALSADYRMDRFRALFDPFAYSRGIGWQIIQSLYAVGSGGLFGLGLGQSRQKYQYLPEAHNDYIFAVVCEELGFIGAMAVILLFTVFVWRGMSIALNAKDRFGMLMAFGITSIIGVQVLINMGVVLSVLPSTGMQLPFFSAGGTSLTIMLAGMGILLNISKTSRIRKF